MSSSILDQHVLLNSQYVRLIIRTKLKLKSILLFFSLKGIPNSSRNALDQSLLAETTGSASDLAEQWKQLAESKRKFYLFQEQIMRQLNQR
jgi:hypothetical protein